MWPGLSIAEEDGKEIASSEEPTSATQQEMKDTTTPPEATSAAQEPTKTKHSIMGGLILKTMRNILEKRIGDFPLVGESNVTQIEQGNTPIKDPKVATYAELLTPKLPENTTLQERINYMIGVIEKANPVVYSRLDKLANEGRNLKMKSEEERGA